MFLLMPYSKVYSATAESTTNSACSGMWADTRRMIISTQSYKFQQVT
jgi:hypothetical protein